MTTSPIGSIIAAVTSMRPRDNETMARLYMAAPDLLAACEEMKLQIEWERSHTGPEWGNGLGDDTLAAYDRLCDAIRKAKGEQL
jgi:hypothetical protein